MNFLNYEFSINGLRRKMRLGGEKVFKDGAGLLLLLRIRSAYVEILGFPMGGAY